MGGPYDASPPGHKGPVDQREYTERHHWREGTRYDQSKARPGWTADEDLADAQVPD
ncbi:hypothetical protein GCM10009764_31330 [Nocardia ninae]|uniref:Uncharacterized protein n=1 Tax=Nocardia ninae NBRC 108245 TaxID=1210091 RepID=A0A511MVD8_9NOCA|nr:hypothetical protein NN4_86560 [Nocardia ninae NBRC 108245]